MAGRRASDKFACQSARVFVIATSRGIIQASSPDQFFRIADPYFGDAEGQMNSIGGLFVQNGYGHVLLNGTGLWEPEPVVTHELAHVAVQHQNLPLWLDEAIAMGIEGLAHGESMHMQDAAGALFHSGH